MMGGQTSKKKAGRRVKTKHQRELARENKRPALDDHGVPEGLTKMYWRPSCRADCAMVPRPCVFVGCRYNMAVDVTEAGSLMVYYDDPSEMHPDLSCVLDIAEHRGHSNEWIGRLLRCTKQRVDQIVQRALPLLGKKVEKTWT
jgi:hypothetical protein